MTNLRLYHLVLPYGMNYLIGQVGSIWKSLTIPGIWLVFIAIVIYTSRSNNNLSSAIFDSYFSEIVQGSLEALDVYRFLEAITL